MAAAPQSTDVEQEATCPICLEYLTAPVTLDCGHNYCLGCITNYCETWEEQGGDLECPVCRVPIQKGNFRHNWQLANIVEQIKLLPLHLEKESLCERHKEKLHLFCKEDEVLVCWKCKGSPEHKSHTVLLKEEAAQEHKDLIHHRLEILREERERILANQADTEKENEDLLEQTRAEREKTVAQFRQLRQLLEDQEKLLLAQMDEVEKEIAKRREEHQARLSEELSSLESLISGMEEKSQKPASEFLQDVRSTLQRSEKETFEHPVAFPPELKRRVWDFSETNPVLEGLMKQFRDVLLPGLHLKKGIVNSKLLNDYLHRIFPSADETQPTAAFRKHLSFQNLQEHLEQLLAENAGSEDGQDQVAEGRLGPSTVVLDHTSGFKGQLLVDDDLLGVIGHSNFDSIRATTCVYKGKWIYEVLISSQGLMQIGWCTLHCRFNHEDGVGDSPDSYAYDGHRVCKWNVTPTKYGKSWAAGDIVSCLIDLDKGNISFCLNGVSLGTAFDNISRGSDMAYFPAISLKFKASVTFNFGSRPLRYPVKGYRPLQDKPDTDLVKAHKLLGYLKNVITIGVDVSEGKLVERDSSTWQLQGEPTVLITLAHIFNHFCPFMVKFLLV